MVEDFLNGLEDCTLCEWRCGVDRLEGELGVCMLEEPRVASATLHPAPPQSYTVFMTGCNFRCLNCQNWEIAHYPVQDTSVRGYVEPKELAEEAVSKIRSTRGRMIGADRIFFSGGSPTPSLPYIEEVVKEARKIDDEVKVNYDTNGFMTESSLKRVLEFTSSLTFDIKAYRDEVHRALTGAPVEPVLRNAEYVAKNAKDKLWEFRYLLIPGVNDEDVSELAEFLASIDEDIPLNFLAFRPNFVLEEYRGARDEDMERAVRRAEKIGLKNVSWSGKTGLPGRGLVEEKVCEVDRLNKIADMIGCSSRPRNCGSCSNFEFCPIKNYSARRRS